MSEASVWKGLLPPKNLPCRDKPERKVHTTRRKPEPAVKAVKPPGRPVGRRYPVRNTPWKLAPAECVVLEMSATKKCAQIARELGMASKTVCTHMERAREKMGANSSTHAVVLYDRWLRATRLDLEVVTLIVSGVATSTVRPAHPVPKAA